MKVLVYQVPAHGHVNPSLAVIAELVRRGDEVVYYLTEPFRGAVEATGATFRAYPQLLPDLLDDVGGNPFILSERLIDACAAMLPKLIDLTLCEQPDAIIYDAMAPWGGIIARHLGLPAIASMSLLALSMPMMVKSGMFPALMGQTIRNLPRVRVYNRKAKALDRSLGTKSPSVMDILNLPGDISLVYTSRAFQPEAATFGDRYKFVGPALADRPSSDAFPFDQLTDRPLVYISLGTVNNQATAFYRATFDAFRDSPVQVVLSVGQASDIASLGAVPANFIVQNHVPQLEVLQRAAAFVTHGGMNSVHEGLYYGVPLVVVPQTVEQTLVAKQVAKLGAGLMLPKATAAELRAAVEQVLGDGQYRAAAAALGTGFREAGGASRAADEIAAYLRTAPRPEGPIRVSRLDS